ncbi:chloride channel protein [Roseomonas gilardii subsp. gilardii]|uniref:chloride channel protein n=1 Tax=Roseomonas gilardii TaxID=257708 RepID=UPI001FFB8B43|nr:chloride channel protein [Roseomonas gilardii]UPG71759.1 chloride channel protein [Roseomonas gilardii subsp. gilardii]
MGVEMSDTAQQAQRPRLRRRYFRRLRRLPLVSPRLWLRRMVFWFGAVLVGLVAIGFAALADRAGAGFRQLVTHWPLLALLVSPACFALASYLTRTVFPGAQGSGIPQVIATLHMDDPKLISQVLSLRIAVGKVLLTLLGLLGGGSIGREGPTVQVGASIMQALAQRLHLPRPETRRAMVLAGGAAGVAAAFNTPLAGIVFAIEELSHSYEGRTSGNVLTAVVIGGVVSLALVGNYTYFGVTQVDLPIGAAWAAVPLCAILGGLCGGAFSWMLVRASRGLPGLAGRFLMRHPVGFAALCGLVVALIGLASGGLTYGTGYAQARGLIEGETSLPASYFAAKLLATVVSYCSGIPGGIFAPSLSVGAGFGATLAELLPVAPLGAMVLLGMVAYFSGVVQAPITAAVIVMEMTDGQNMIIPLMATSFIATGASRLICRRPLYGALARRFLHAVERR